MLQARSCWGYTRFLKRNLSEMPSKQLASTEECSSPEDGTSSAESQKTTRPKVKRAASSSKRKASSPSPEEASNPEESTRSKKAKVDSAGGLAANGQPTNNVLPVNIHFPQKTPGTLRLAAWNICGLAASSKKAWLLCWTCRLETHRLITGIQVLRGSGGCGRVGID